MCLSGQPLRRRGTGRRVPQGGVDVVEVERDACHGPLVGVDLDDAEYLGAERLWPLVSAHVANTTQGEALSADRNYGRRYFVTPWSAVARRPASDSRPCRRPASTTRRRSSTECRPPAVSAIAVQSRAAKHVWKRSATRLAAFSSRRAGDSVHRIARARRRVCLVEYFAAAHPVTVDRQEVDHPPLGVEAVL